MGVATANPAVFCQGRMDPQSSFGSTADVIAAAERGETRRLTEYYRCVKEVSASSEPRLFPSGRLVKMSHDRPPREATHAHVNEMVVRSDMVSDHMPRCYIR